jgi:hypothetical protein
MTGWNSLFYVASSIIPYVLAFPPISAFVSDSSLVVGGILSIRWAGDLSFLQEPQVYVSAVKASFRANTLVQMAVALTAIGWFIKIDQSFTPMAGELQRVRSIPVNNPSRSRSRYRSHHLQHGEIQLRRRK